jgi:hypothetical protein
MDRVIDKTCRGSEVPLRALWCKARGRWRSLATSHRERRREDIYIEVNVLIYNPVNGRSSVGSLVIKEV